MTMAKETVNEEHKKIAYLYGVLDGYMRTREYLENCVERRELDDTSIRALQFVIDFLNAEVEYAEARKESLEG